MPICLSLASRAWGPQDELPGLLRRWFGADAGQPGTGHRVLFRKRRPDEGSGEEVADVRWVMEPVNAQDSRSEPWREYSREEIPGLLGHTFKGPVWQQGFIVVEKDVFLLVTLQKDRHGDNAQYDDRFISPTEFQWQSQNRTTQASKHGQIISRHQELGYTVHLWIRDTATRNGRATPFRYCGPVEYLRWEGEKPITVWWRLQESVPERYWGVMGVGEDR